MKFPTQKGKISVVVQPGFEPQVQTGMYTWLYYTRIWPGPIDSEAGVLAYFCLGRCRKEVQLTIYFLISMLSRYSYTGFLFSDLKHAVERCLSAIISPVHNT
jgi:hypothetical protein